MLGKPRQLKLATWLMNLLVTSRTLFCFYRKIFPKKKGALYQVEKHVQYNLCANLSNSVLVLLGNTRIRTLKYTKNYALCTL